MKLIAVILLLDPKITKFILLFSFPDPLHVPKRPTIYDKELLAIVSALDYWRHLLKGTSIPFTNFSDHHNLLYQKKPEKMTQRLVRWVLFLSNFNFIIVYHFGSTNGKANTLYLRPDYTLSNNDSSFSDTSFTVLRSENLCAITSLVTFLICLDNIAFASLDNI